MKKYIMEKAKENGACAAGVVRARKFTELREVLEKRGRVSLCEEDIEKRIDPFLLMPEAKSIIVCLFFYKNNRENRISQYAQGIDYHEVLINRLGAVCTEIEKKGFYAKAFADNSPLCERYLAYLSGSGFFGKNGMLINPEYGSFVFIGCILTDCELEEDSPLKSPYCMGCGRCIEACPGKALGENFEFSEEKCASFLTQKKGELSFSEENIIKKSGYIWGCDLCQRVCPYNYTEKTTNIQEFFTDLISENEISSELSNREFKREYKKRAFSWRGKAVLERNKRLFR